MDVGKRLAIAILVAAVGVAAETQARGRWGRVNVGPAPSATELGPWVGGPWDVEWAEKLPYGHTPWGTPIRPPVDEWYPWGYVAPFVRVGRQCVANDVNVGLDGDIVRYQRVRPRYYCGER